MQAMHQMLILHKLRSVRSSDRISVDPADKVSIFNNVFRNDCCLMGQNITLSWPPTTKATATDNEKVFQMHAVVYELLKDLSAPPPNGRSSNSSVSSNKDSYNRDEKKLNALRTLHELTASKFKENRMLMVCTTKYDILATLTACLEQSISCEQPTDMRRSICLIFNNLSIPFDNKAVMVLGPSSRALLLNLLNVILFNLPEAYLCCICLMNLSILHDAKDIIFYLSQNEKSYKKHIHTCISPTPIISDARTRSGFGGGSKSRGTMQPTILDDSMSLIRGLERLMKSNSPFLVSNLYSVEGEAVRWSVGLLRSFTKAQSYCNIICNTTIPMLLVEALKSSPRNVLEWTTDSLEEMALICLCDLVRWPIGREVLQNTSSMLDEIAKVGGIHGYRASVISSAISMREV